MEAGTLVEWLVTPGQRVRRGDIVAVVETQKGAIEIEVFEDGVFAELLVTEGQRVPVGALLGRLTGVEPAPPVELRAPQAPLPQPAPPKSAPPKPTPTRRPTLGSAPQTRSTGAPRVNRRRLASSPASRRLARELEVDLHDVTGTGPHGAIRSRDVARAAQEAISQAADTPAASPAPAPRPTPAPEVGLRPADGMREAIAAAMTRSAREIPQLHLQLEIDMEPALRWMERENRQRTLERRLLPSALLTHAVAHGLARVPALNGTWTDGAFTPGEGVHLALVVGLRGGGLVTPVLPDAHRLDLDETMNKMQEMVERARRGRLRGSDLMPATSTLTLLGERSVDVVNGVIYPPQVALIGAGRIAERPFAIGGMLGVRRTVILTVTADHRAVDGHQGGRLLGAIARSLTRMEHLTKKEKR